MHSRASGDQVQSRDRDFIANKWSCRCDHAVHVRAGAEALRFSAPPQVESASHGSIQWRDCTVWDSSQTCSPMRRSAETSVVTESVGVCVRLFSQQPVAPMPWILIAAAHAHHSNHSANSNRQPRPNSLCSISKPSSAWQLYWRRVMGPPRAETRPWQTAPRRRTCPPFSSCRVTLSLSFSFSHCQSRMEKMRPSTCALRLLREMLAFLFQTQRSRSPTRPCSCSPSRQSAPSSRTRSSPAQHTLNPPTSQPSSFSPSHKQEQHDPSVFSASCAPPHTHRRARNAKADAANCRPTQEEGKEEQKGKHGPDLEHARGRVFGESHASEFLRFVGPW